MARLGERGALDASPKSIRRAPNARIELIKTALTIRRVEERLLDLFAQGRIYGTVHTCVGQEFSGIAVARALRPGDFMISNHRGHGHYLAWTDDVEGLIAEVMGKETGPCGGRGGSQHLCRDSFFSNGVQGGMAPVSAGIALGRKRRASRTGARGDDTATSPMGAIWIGDGTLGEGTLYEALNLISKWQLPLLVVLENNGYAQSTSATETLAGDILARPRAFGIATTHSNTWQWEQLLDDAEACASAVRTSGQPHFLQIDTYRLRPHSKGDDNRAPSEIAEYLSKDPLQQMLTADPTLGEVTASIERRIDEAVKRADAASPQSPRHLEPVEEKPLEWRTVEFAEERVVKSIRTALEAALAADPRVILIGEDIRSPYGGAFKVTQGLSDRFPDRVLNTPISEAAIVGVGSGLALEGMRPVVEIMFGDFVLLAADQFVNHAAKFRWMYNEQVQVPLIVRTPMGGHRGYGPTHSQSLEKHLLGVPDTQVLAIHGRYPPELVYRTLFETIERPTLVVENKILYGQMTACKAPDGFVIEHSNAAFPTTRIRPADAAANLTLVAYGGMVQEAESALLELFTEHDLLCELLIPVSLYPLDLRPIQDSVARSGALLVIEEGQGFAGFASELAAALVERGQVFRLRRVAAAPHPIPTSRPFERAVLPTTSSIVRAAVELQNG